MKERLKAMDNTTKNWAKAALGKCVKKYERVAEKHKDGIPYTTDAKGNYDNRADKTRGFGADDGLNWWTNGFWGGILWHLYVETQNPRFLEIARTSERLLDKCLSDFYGLHHDVGFMWLPTAVTDYMLTGSAESRKRALHAANILAGRFNLAGRFIRAWNNWGEDGADTRGWAIIDCMMNIPLLYWASAETKDPRYGHIAAAHAGTVIKRFVRPDGSSEHIVEFDPESGNFVKIHGGQGYAAGSAWTRGQAWSLYGFTISHKMTGEQEYLATAEKTADFFASQIPPSGIIPIDFNQPEEPALEDSCGAAIAACGFLELSRFCGGAKKEKYEQAAVKILKALDEKRSDYGETCDAILRNCSAAYHSVESRHITMVYADYFYIEALAKIFKGETGFIW
jgi:unsaturated chondroitin disaccharide hydrolase